MSERMISFKESEAKEILKAIERMLAYWTSGGTNAYRTCAFCSHSDDFRGRLNHHSTCAGIILLNLLNKKIKELDDEMDVIKIADLMKSDEVDPTIGVAAIRWLANYYNHGMETKAVMRAIRSIKEKLGIPF